MKDAVKTFDNPEVLYSGIPTKKTFEMPKIIKMLDGLTDPEKLLKAVLPLKGNLLIEAFSKFPYKKEEWNAAIFIRELEPNEETETDPDGLSLLDLLSIIKLGEIKILIEVIQWKHKETIGIFIKTK